MTFMTVCKLLSADYISDFFPFESLRPENANVSQKIYKSYKLYIKLETNISKEALYYIFPTNTLAQLCCSVEFIQPYT